MELDMFWINYFTLIACFMAFIISLFELIVEPDVVIKVVRAFVCMTSAVAGIIISMGM